MTINPATKYLQGFEAGGLAGADEVAGGGLDIAGVGGAFSAEGVSFC